MPTAPAVACHCGALNCTKHSAKANAKAHDQWRGTAASRGYGRRWSDKLRPMIMRRYPLCADPFGIGCINASTIGDHIVPKAAGGEDTLENGQGLCDNCHNRKIKLEQAVSFQWACSCRIPTMVTVTGCVITLSCDTHAQPGARPLMEWCRLVEAKTILKGKGG